ncbi:MAG: 5-formyltetrahydrofolate cyclo-ligase [Bacteroidaceae bacterium]|nr:5-formyltetrahydrofolate cyclo-ligase [Bacteroidaceae bacterium]
MNKQELRTLIRQRKKQHSTEELSASSQRLSRLLLDRIQKEDGIRTILLYHSMPDEVETHQLIKNLHSIGKKILLPTIVGDELELHEYLDETAFSTSAHFSIQESTGPLFTNYAAIDLAIIPGMAFTPQGDRLGRGKGYYDRLLPKLQCPLIGLAFSFQVVDAIPSEVHDVRMTEIVSG